LGSGGRVFDLVGWGRGKKAERKREERMGPLKKTRSKNYAVRLCKGNTI